MMISLTCSEMMLRYVTCFLTLLIYCRQLKGCNVTLDSLYSRVNTDVTVEFSITTPPAGSLTSTYRVYDNNDTAILQVRYQSGTATVTENGVTFTGDADTGDIKFIYRNIPQSKAGQFSIRKTLGVVIPEQCVTLYILGTPTTPAVSISQNPDVGGDVNLTCSGSTSTTSPTGHGLGMTYSWMIDGASNPANSRYAYTYNRNQVTVYSVVSSDANKQFVCTATEDVTGSLTSARSGQKSFAVYYGPDNIQFTPVATVYEEEEGTTLDPIRCTADCYSSCAYTWTRLGQSQHIGTDGTLTLGTLQSSETGTYRCTANNPGRTGRPGNTVTKDVIINVIFGPRNIVLSPTRSTYRELEGFSMPVIRCTAACYECTYTWSGPVSLAAESQLNLGTLSKTKHGTYTCTARNTKSSTTQTATTTLNVEVKYGPNLVTLTPTATEYTRDIGTVLNDIQCSSNCFPTCTYRWTKEGQTNAVSEDGRLSFGTLQTSYAGLYTCTVRNPEVIGTASTATVRLRVKYGPESLALSPSPTTYIRNEGTSLQDIMCSDTCYPGCTYTWTIAGRTGTLTTTGVLSLGQLNHTEAGNYTCTARNPDRTNSPQTKKTVSLNVRYGPDAALINRESPYTVIERNTGITIGCSSDCYPSCTFSWTNITNNSPTGAGGVISLAKVTRYDAGRYRCISSNTASQYNNVATSTVTVVVQYAPDVIVTTQNVTVNDSHVDIFCSPSGVPASYTYQPWTQAWISDGHTVPLLTQLGNSPTLRLTDLSYQHSGLYTCRASNGVTESMNGNAGQGDVHLKVESFPIITEPVVPNGQYHEVSTRLDTHIPAIISVQYYNNGDTPNVNCYKLVNNTRRTSNVHTFNSKSEVVQLPVFAQMVNTEGTTTTITMALTKTSQLGFYVIVIKNNIGEGVVPVQIVLEVDKPEAPTNIRHIPELTTVSSLTIMWKSGFNGGLDQTFKIEYKAKSDEQWTINILQEPATNITLDGLSTGTIYEVQISAYNAIGTSSSTEIEAFKTAETQVQVQPNNTALLVGTFVGSIAVIVIVISAVVIFRRQRNLGKCTCLNTSNKNSKQFEDVPQDQHVYYNMSPTVEATGDIILNEIDRDTGTATYESTISSNPKEHVYTDLKIHPQGVSTSQTGMEMYENLKIQTSR